MSDDRTPPTRVRLTGLQEAQLPAIAAIEQATAEMYYAIGFDAAEVPPRTAGEIAKLPRDHDVLVAEADHVPAGYLAWRDEQPGVAFIAECSVHPDFQHFGVGTRLMDGLYDSARRAKLEHIAVKCWKKATWAYGFYAKLGFKEIGENAAPKILAWQKDRSSSGRPFTRPGEVALWRETPPAPKPVDVDDDEPAAED
jgi:amino-acid N-acetyltransferase